MAAKSPRNHGVAATKFSKLGSALLQQMPAGASSSVSTVEGGKGTVSWQQLRYMMRIETGTVTSNGKWIGLRGKLQNKMFCF